jgi:hypothetical protein
MAALNLDEIKSKKEKGESGLNLEPKAITKTVKASGINDF